MTEGHTHAPNTHTYTDRLINTFMHIHALIFIYCALHIQMQNRYNTHTHCWINTLGHNPKEEPYGTSIYSSYKNGRVNQGVCVFVRQSEFVCMLYISSFIKVLNTFYTSTETIIFVCITVP